MAAAVYVLCFLTSLACAVLLLRAFKNSGARLLLWSGICFLGLALNNLALFADRVIWPDQDLFYLRTMPALIGIAALIYGLVWEGE